MRQTYYNITVIAIAQLASLLLFGQAAHAQPTVSFTINNGAAYTNIRTSDLYLNVTGAPTQMYITGTAGCGANGKWVAYATPTPRSLTNGDGVKTLYLKVRDAGNVESTCVTDSIILDSAAPTLVVTNPVNGTYVNAANQTAVPANGTCSEEGQNVTVSGHATGSAVCTGGVWSMDMDMSAAPEGALSVTFTHLDLATNDALATRSLTKDTGVPTADLISINSGASVTTSTAVNLTLGATGADKMYITNDAGCATGGSWLNYATAKNWTLTTTNGISPVYVKFRDTALNETACISDTIIHDNTGPTSPTIVIDNTNARTNITNVSLALSAVDVAEMYVTNGAGCNNGGAWETYATSKAWVLGQTNATATVYVKYRDANGIESTCVSDTIVHDDIAPTATSISINGGAATTTSTSVTLTLAATGSSQMYITNDNTCATGGTWINTTTSRPWTLLNLLASNSVYVKFIDLAGNVSACISDSIIHDAVPTLTFTQPASTSVYTLNQAAITLGGACSVEGQTVTLSGAITNTATCTGGAWSRTVDLTALPEGSNIIYADMTTIYGTPAVQASRTLVKDITPPSSPSVSINGTWDPLLGMNYTRTSTVTLALSAVGATQMYYTDDPTCATGGSLVAYSTSGNWVLPSLNTTVSVYAKFVDNVGNETACVSGSILHDNTAPIFAMSTPLANAYVTSGNMAAFSVSGTCSDDAFSVELSSPSTATLPCAAGVWSTTLDLSLNAEGPINITVDYSDDHLNAAPTITRQVIKDTVVPSMTLTNWGPTIWVSSVNQGARTIDGTCTEDGDVNITGAVTGTTLCAGGVWAITFDLTSQPSGTFQASAVLVDAAGNTSASVALNFEKDTVAPTAAITTAGAGLVITNLNVRSVTLTGTCSDVLGVVYVNGGPAGIRTTCVSGNTWLVRMNMSLIADGNVPISVTHTDIAGNPSVAAQVTFDKDATAPVWTDKPTHSGFFNSFTASPVISYLNNATDATSGVQKYQYAIGKKPTGIESNNIKDWTDAPASGFTVSGLTLEMGIRYYVNMRVYDNYGNFTALSSTGWMIDTSPPVLTITTPTQNEVFSEVDVRVYGGCETTSTLTINYGANMSGPATVPCFNKFFAFVAEVSGSSGARTLDVVSTDTASNTATVTLNFSYIQRAEVLGQVYAVAKAADGSTYYGGSFSGYGLSTKPGAVRMNASGVQDAAFNIRSGFKGNVFASVELPDGSMVFGGDFINYRGYIAYRLAKVNRDGTIDTTFNPQIGSNGANGAVRAMVVNGSSIYVGGDFSNIKGKIAFRVAKLDFDGNVDLTFNPAAGSNGANGIVRALALNGNNLYIGGDFTLYRDAAAAYLAKVDATTGVAFGAFTAAGPNNDVMALHIANSSLYVGGNFTSYQSSPANAITKVDLNSGAIDTGFSPSSGANGFTSAAAFVNAIASYGSDLIVVGKFTSYRSAAANYIARLSSSGVLDTTFNPASGANGLSDQGFSLLVVGSNIYVGGQFISYRDVPVRSFAKLSGDGSLDASYHPAGGTASVGFDGAVSSILLSSQSEIYVSGSFSAYRADYVAHNILKIDSGGNFDSSFHPQAGANGFNGPVYALAVDDSNNVYVGGDFTTYEASPALNVAKISSAGDLDLAFNPASGANGVNDTVYALAFNSTSLYVGGQFTQYRGVVANRIAKVAVADGVLDTTFNPATGFDSAGFNNKVHSMAVIGSNIYVGGAFSTYRTKVASRIAKIDMATGALDLTFNPASGANGANNSVFAITASGTDLFIGGAFTAYRGVTANRVAKVASDTGAIIGAFNTTVGANSIVYALAASDTALYVGGVNTLFQSLYVNRVAKVDITTAAVDTTFSPVAPAANGITGLQPRVRGLTPTCTSLFYDGGELFVGGAFTTYRNHRYNHSVIVNTSGQAIP